MDSPEHCDSANGSTKQNEFKESAVVPRKEKQKGSNMDSQKPNVVEEMCENYFSSLKTDLFLSSLYLVVTSYVVLLSVLLAFAKVTLPMSNQSSLVQLACNSKQNIDTLMHNSCNNIQKKVNTIFTYYI